MAIRTFGKTVLLAQSTGRQEAIWRSALQSQGLHVASLPRGEALRALVEASPARARRADLAVIDLAELAAENLRLPAFGPALAKARPDLQLVASLGERLEIAPPERRWAQAHGALDLCPALSMTHAAEQSVACVARVCQALGRAGLDEEALRRAMRAIAGEVAEAESDIVARLAHRGIDMIEVARRMRGSAGVALKERRFRLKWYRDCFVGSEADEWLVRNYGVTREEGAEIGQHLLERGVIHHVVKEQPFQDGAFYYRFSGTAAALDEIEVDALIARIRSPNGVAIAERTYLGRAYPACFVGRALVDWLAATYRVDREDAVTLGQRLVDLRLLHHVLDEHDFVDGYYFYRFHEDEPPA